MHPGFFWHRRRHRHRHEEGAEAVGCGPCGHGGWGAGGFGPPMFHFGGRHGEDFGGGSFGVRRPLRFLAWKLELEQDQVAEFAKILNDLKTERAQAAVDTRRSTSALADAVAGEAFDEAQVIEAASVRVKTAEQLRDAVVKALGRMHAVLDAEQRERLAYLIRTGALSI